MVEASFSRAPSGAGADTAPTKPAARSPFRSFRSDDRGQLLILTGVLLVLGFVMLGATFIELQTLGETTQRVQRDGVVDPIRDLIDDFNQTIAQGVGIGQTDIEDFRVMAERGEHRMRDAAVRSGMYVSVQLNPNPDTSIFFRESRCLAYDATYTQDGVVIGYEHPSMQQTIVGAVYTIEITDGRQNLEMDYYVKMFDCMLDDATVYPNDNETSFGNSHGFAAALDPDDSDAAFVVQEQLTGLQVVEAASPFNASAFQGVFWSNPEWIQADDGSTSDHPGSNIVDRLQWKWKTPDGMLDGYVLQDVDLEVQAKYFIDPNQWLVTKDDHLRIAGYKDATMALLESPFCTETVPVTETDQSFAFNDLLSPSGTADWTKDEWNNAVWRIYTDEVLLKDDGRKFMVDFVEAQIDYTAPTRNQLDERLEWSSIPDIYDTHTLELRYHKDTAEHFQIQIKDFGEPESDWSALGDDLVTTGWNTWSALLPYDDLTDVDLHVRVIDLDDTDNAPADRDQIQFDYIRVQSQLPDP